MKKETKKALLRYLATTGMIYAFSLMFSLFSLIFIVDKIPKWVRFLVSFIFIAPMCYMLYSQGKSQGEKIYKENTAASLDNLHDMREIKLPYYKCVFHVIGFVIPMFILFIAAVIAKSHIVRLIGFAFEFPAALLFSSINVVDTAHVAATDLAIFLPYTLLLAGFFVLGYILKAYRLKKQHGRIRGEIRSFDN